MAKRYYFLLASLPPLPELGGPLPMPLPIFCRMTREEGDSAEVVEAILLEQDLLARQTVLAGGEGATPLVLSAEQAAGTAPLPESLVAPADRPRRLPADATWEAYWCYASAVGRRLGCAFLGAYVGFEVMLRNALVSARAAALGLEARPYLVALDLAEQSRPVGSSEHRVAEAVAAWAAAPDPLAALRAVDRVRARWTMDQSHPYAFDMDELAAYARQMVLVARWHEIGLASAPAGP